jgi:hypothetical protein
MNRLQDFLERPEPTMAVTITQRTPSENTKDILALEIDPVAEVRVDTFDTHYSGFFMKELTCCYRYQLC